MRPHLVSLFALFLFVGHAPAAFIVVANYTPEDVAFTLAEPNGKPRKHTLPAYHVLPFDVAGPAGLTPVSEGKPNAVGVVPYHAYVFIPDESLGVRLEGIELPGQMPDADKEPEAKLMPRKPVKIPVVLLVDDEELRTEAGWQKELRCRLERAAAVLETQCGIQFDVARFGTWKSDPEKKKLSEQLLTFEDEVRLKPGEIAIGYMTRALEEKANAPNGFSRGHGATHILLREWRPRAEVERVELLIRELAMSLGAVGSPDPGSVMREKINDGLALHAKFVLRLDPLNVLALNLWADQRRAGVTTFKELPRVAQARLLRTYQALLQASPRDEHASAILRELERDFDPTVKPKLTETSPTPGQNRLTRTEAIRAVVRAVTERAKANTGRNALKEDALTVELLKAAAKAASAAEESDRADAFLIGIGVALDEGASLRHDPNTRNAVRDLETVEEWKQRLVVLGNPTMFKSGELRRRFVVGCATSALLKADAAEDAAIGTQDFAKHREAGFSFTGLAAEFAGISFAQQLKSNPNLLEKVEQGITVADVIPDMKGLRDGLSTEVVEREFGGRTDPRFTAVLTDIHKRIAALPFHTTKE